MKQPIVRKLLLIDDELEFLQSLKLFLDSSGYFVSIAQNLDQAISAIQKHDFDLILTDIEMPIRSGIEIVEMLVEGLGVMVPIVILTGFSDKLNLSVALRLGISDFITKPVQPNMLLDVIKYQINKHKRKSQDFDLDHALVNLKKKYIFIPEEYFNFSIVSFLFSEIQKSLFIEPVKKNELFMILEEALSNAFLHGIWQLSIIERSYDIETLIQRVAEINLLNRAIKNTKQYVTVDLLYVRSTGRLHITITDTGSGFDYQLFMSNLSETQVMDQIHGRGIFLIKTLSEQMTFSNNGSQIEIILKISEPEKEMPVSYYP
jgi:DNA-binding response OmpR family regulator